MRGTMVETLHNFKLPCVNGTEMSLSNSFHVCAPMQNPGICQWGILAYKPSAHVPLHFRMWIRKLQRVADGPAPFMREARRADIISSYSSLPFSRYWSNHIFLSRSKLLQIRFERVSMFPVNLSTLSLISSLSPCTTPSSPSTSHLTI